MNDIALKINGRSYTNWTNVHIHKSMNSICGAFGVGNFDVFNTNPNAYDIKLGYECIVEIDGNVVCTGYVEDLPIEYAQEGGITLQLRGRDKTCDLVDCSYTQDVNEWKNQTVFNLIYNLCLPFGIQVVVDDSASTQTNTIVPEFKANEGETAFNLISRLCRDYSILPLSYGDGKLTLTNVATDRRATDVIQLSGNAIFGRIEQSNKDRYSTYIVKGQGIGNDNKQYTDFIEPNGSFDDDIIDRYRPLVLFSETPTDYGKCANRAKFEARMRAGWSRKIIYEVLNWHQSDNSLWDINTTVMVRDEYLGVNTTKLIYEVDYLLNQELEQPITRIGVVDKTTYNLSSAPIKIKSEFDQ